MSDSLLPPNASDLELAVEKVLSRTEQIPVTIDTLWDPETAPENTLPWLAWALSVDEWSSAWSVETKRRVIANSVELHRKKGTRGAINLAMSGINIETEITEWFEQSPPGRPGTFNVDATLNADGFTFDQWRELSGAIHSAKNVRSHCTVSMRSEVQSTMPVYAGVTFGADYILQPYISVSGPLNFDLVCAAAVQFASAVTINPMEN